MFSRGILFALASATIVRRRGFMSTSPPPLRAATESSLMIRVKILPRLASAAPFLCLIVCHLEWPDMRKLQKKQEKRYPILTLLRENHPDFGSCIPRAAAVIAEQRGNLKASLL